MLFAKVIWASHSILISANHAASAGLIALPCDARCMCRHVSCSSWSSRFAHGGYAWQHHALLSQLAHRHPLLMTASFDASGFGFRNHAEENKRRTLQRTDVAAAITRTDIFDFLVRRCAAAAALWPEHRRQVHRRQVHSTEVTHQQFFIN